MFNTENDYGLVTMDPECKAAAPVGTSAAGNTVLSVQQESLTEMNDHWE